MFIAQSKTGNVISILNATKDVLSSVEKKAPFYCPVCKQEVVLKKGKIKVPHFAHKTNCSIKPEGETETHVLGKKKLYTWLQNQGYQPQLETYLPEIRQRPDLLFHWKGRRIVMEFQCSIIPSEEVFARSINYLKYNYCPIWIMNQSIVKESAFIIHINEFISQFILKTARHSLILSFLPEKNELNIYTNIIPFSKNRAIVCQNKGSLENSLESIFHYNHSRINFLPYWITVSEKWLINQPLFPDARKNPFLQFLYQQKLHPTDLPWEIGIPLPETYVIETPPVEWQFYIWYFFLYTRKKGSIINEDDLSYFVFHKINQLIRFRKTPFIKKRDHFQPIKSYLEFLTSLGFFRNNGDTLIVVKKPEILKNGNVDRRERKQAFYRENKHKIMKFFY